MRLDRFITLNLVHPLRRALVTHHASPVTFLPVLMYHSISDNPEPGVRPYYQVCTGPQRFREQMQWLKDNDFRGVALSEGLAWLKAQSQNSQPSTLNHQPAVLTFDDGFRDFYMAAWPILREFGFTATMYLPTAFIGESRRQFQPATLNPQLSTKRDCLTWTEVKELHRAGVEFGSHTVHHPELVDLPWPDIQSEIADSKAQIENQLGAPVKAFAYPYAFPQTRRDFVDRFKDMLMAGGYGTCVTTQIGRHRPGADPLQIKRLAVNSGDDDKLFQAKVEGSYDWLALPQKMIKKFKSRIPGLGGKNNCATQSVRSCEPALDSRTSDS